MEGYAVLWAKIADALQQELSATSYQTWIEPLKAVSMGNGKLTILVPDAMVRDAVQTRYLAMIQRAIEDVNEGAVLEPVFVLPSEWTTSETPRLKRVGTLNPNYTFDSFVVGQSNQFAWAAAVGTAKSPGTKYNPLFIYGGTGLGKTHLMHAIGHEILLQNPEANVLYVTSEQFINEMISALQSNRNEQFRDRYRNVDALLIDDVQFIANKGAMMEEFFHTFNALYEANKQIVLTSDKPPKEISALEERLRSRFEWGLIADIAPPDYETRVAILRNKAQKEGLEIAEDGVMESIAMRVESNIRELEGSLNRVMAYAALTGRPVTRALAEDALKDYFSPKTTIVTPNSIIQCVCAQFDVTVEDLRAKKRSRDVARPRQIAMYLIRELTDLSLPKTGELFGGRDHTTVMHACEKIANDIRENPQMKETVDDLIARIKE